EFLQHAGCAACALGADHLFSNVSSAAAAEAYARLDDAARGKLADMALDLASRAGASYADVRIGRYESEYIHARERRIDQLTPSHAVGFGVRVLHYGSWGFAASETITEDEVRAAVALAVENARASRLIQTTPIVIEDVPAYREDWRMPMQIDPFTISSHDKAAKLLAINEAILRAGADYAAASFRFVREEKLFASSRGSRINQMRVRTMPDFSASAVDRQSGRFAGRAGLAAPRGAGWEYIESYD